MGSAESRKNNPYSRKRRSRGNKYQTSSGSPQARKGQLQAEDPGSLGNAVGATESRTGVNKDGSINLSSSNSTSSENCTSAKKIKLQLIMMTPIFVTLRYKYGHVTNRGT